MLTANEITEIFCLSDEFSKEFDATTQKYKRFHSIFPFLSLIYSV